MRWSYWSALIVALNHLSVHSQTNTADTYLAAESPIAKAGLLANIGPDGTKSQGAKAGIVIASPSKSSPDYFYTWTRDSSLVFQEIIDQYTLGLDTSTRTQIDNFIGAQKILQQVSNPSGTVSSGGLGEPKFNTDESAFTGGWGRPQRDGPALRANALITWSNYLLANGNSSYVTSTLWPIIKLDLDYVASNWNQTGFDLWEEVNSSSFFTTAVQHRSLRQGATLATSLGQTASASTYTTQADNVLCFQQSYWSTTVNYTISNTGGGRSGKDANSVLTSIHTFDPAAGCDSVTFQPCSDKALSNLLVYVQAFSIYTINSGIPANQGVATGRYPEDSYYGGNPWYLTTLAVAEQLYGALIVWNQQGSLNVTQLSLPFFTNLVPDVQVSEFVSTSATFKTITSAVKTYADSFVSIVAKYTPAGGGLSEQYTRAAGVPTSAPDLTWSYAALLTAYDRRSGVVPASWGAKGLSVPATCKGNTGGGGGGGKTIPVTFNLQYSAASGETIFVSGSIDPLDNWATDDAVQLTNQGGNQWSVIVNIPSTTTFQYKYFKKSNGAVSWETGSNRTFTTPPDGNWIINDVWQGDSGGGGGSGNVAVTFSVQASTVTGESIYVTGSIGQLANWDPNNAIALTTTSSGTWTVTVNIPASTTFQYKYIRKLNGGITWEADPNRQATTPASGTYSLNDTWKGSTGGSSGVAVTFNVQASTASGESIYLTGSIDALVNWSPSAALALASTGSPTWSVTVTIAPGTAFQYKYIKKNSSGGVTWESDPNRQYTVSSTSVATISDTWR